MVTKELLQTIISGSVRQAVLNVIPLEVNPGKYHNLLSKSFVASVGNQLMEIYKEIDCDLCFRNWNYEKQIGISGEWLLDIVIAKRRPINDRVGYIHELILALESEMAAGSKAFVDDFSKLLVVNAPIKVYINGVEAKDKKSRYIESRLKLIQDILANYNNNDKYYICFVDHPSVWPKIDKPLVIVEDMISNTFQMQ
ncbi:MAG TPA: hypothetical protein VNS32_10035 [Flavisolibacter sp.]|nr:hypothetical protein [Flavisolibacter sp.]